MRLLGLLLLGCAWLRAAEPVPDARRGVYAVWLAPGQDAADPFVRGGQAVAQWRDVEPREGQYDFSLLDRQLEAMEKRRRAATVQINGNLHPEWMFSRVPYIEKKLSPQVRDARGTLAYWHPVYRQAYRRMIQAYGQHLRSSPLRDTVLGVRLNFNALGTEHLEVPEGDRAPERWTVPQSTPAAEAWTHAVAADYRREVVDNFVESFLPDVRVFLRNNMAAEMADALEDGRLALFHTSSEMEPRPGSSAQYEAFFRYCRSGKTVCYAEPWADAWGNHGGMKDPRWCGPEQFNYWRVLADLNCGVSFLAFYGADLKHSAEPEFRATFEFAARYAAHHASPTHAPGAWVALREGNGLKGDYTFLMQRSGEMAAVEKAGPADQRFGAWARVLHGGRTARFHLDPEFAASLKSDATVNVTYLDEGRGSFTLECGGRKQTVQLERSGRWQTAGWKVDASGGHIAVKAAGDITLHMVEVRR